MRKFRALEKKKRSKQGNYGNKYSKWKLQIGVFQCSAAFSSFFTQEYHQVISVKIYMRKDAKQSDNLHADIAILEKEEGRLTIIQYLINMLC